MDLGVIAHARAEATLEDGRRALRSYFRFGGGVPDARRRTRTFGVRWPGEACSGIACRRPVARWVDEHTLEVSRYEWPERGLAIATDACVRLARSERAIEVGVRSSGPLTLDSHGGLQLERALVAGARGLEIRHVVPFRNVEDAERGANELREASPVWASLEPLSTGERTVSVAGSRVRLVEFHSWTDLEMVREDERLRVAAAVRLRERAVPVALEETDVRRLAVVRHQVRVRRAALAREAGPGRREMAMELATLLERAFAEHPSELWIAERLARVELDELRRPERAAALVRRVLASTAPADLRLWGVLAREALAGQGASGLAEALLDAEIASSEADALRGAEDLIRLRADGLSYEWAEGAWLLSRSLPAPLPMARARGRLSRGGVVSALLALARFGGTGDANTVQFAVLTAEQLSAGVVGASRPELVVVRAPRGGSIIVAAIGGVSLIEANRLARRVDAMIGAGPISIIVQLSQPGGAAGLRHRLDGTMQTQGFDLRRASRSISGVDFDDVQRYLAQPLSELSPALFPPPQLTVRAQSPEEAELMARAASAFQSRCEAAGPMFRCSAPGQPDALGELLLELARPRVDGLLQPAP